MRLHLASRVSTPYLCTKNETMAPGHKRELPKYEHLGSLPYFCTKNEIMAPLHVATLTVKRALPKYLASRGSTLCGHTNRATLIQDIYPTSVPRMLHYHEIAYLVYRTSTLRESSNETIMRPWTPTNIRRGPILSSNNRTWFPVVHSQDQLCSL